MSSLDQSSSVESPLSRKGVLEFYFETGTEGARWAFQDKRFIVPVQNDPTRNELWLREGLHFLSDGDLLTIFSKELAGAIEWQGEIKLRKYEPYAESVYGLAIHADQEGVDRETWAKYFIDGLPALLVPKNN